MWRAALWRRRYPSGGGWRWGGAPPPRTLAAATGSGGGHLQDCRDSIMQGLLSFDYLPKSDFHFKLIVVHNFFNAI